MGILRSASSVSKMMNGKNARMARSVAGMVTNTMTGSRGIPVVGSRARPRRIVAAAPGVTKRALAQHGKKVAAGVVGAGVVYGGGAIINNSGRATDPGSTSMRGY